MVTHLSKYQLFRTRLFVTRKSFIVKLLLIEVSGRRLVDLRSDIDIESPLD
jgi:hypothetical protein